MSSCAVDVSKFSDTSDRWSIEYMLVVDLQGRAACNSLKEIAIVVVHHDRTPQCSIAYDTGRNITKNKCSNGFLYPGIPACWESDDVEICRALIDER